MTLLQETLYIIFNLCIKNRLAPLLKKKGFKKKGYIWNRRRGDFIDVVDIQISRKCSSEKNINFTINFGICVPNVVTKVFDTIKMGEKDFIGEADCLVRARPGELNLDPEIIKGDSWWNLTSREEIDKAFEQIENIFNDKAFMFLNYFDSIEKIKDFIIRKDKKIPLYDYELIQLAIIFFMLDKNKDAQAILSKIINKEVGWREKATLVAQKLGLIL